MNYMLIVVIGTSLGIGCYSGISDSARPFFDRTAVGPTMRAGENCLRCHGEGRDGSSVKWSLGGTVFPERKSDIDDGYQGAKIVVTDAAGRTVEMTSNVVGNFWTAEALKFPLQAEIRVADKVRKMPIPVPAGSCNACHSASPAGGAEGAIVPP